MYIFYYSLHYNVDFQYIYALRLIVTAWQSKHVLWNKTKVFDVVCVAANPNASNCYVRNGENKSTQLWQTFVHILIAEIRNQGIAFAVLLLSGIIESVSSTIKPSPITFRFNFLQHKIVLYSNSIASQGVVIAYQLQHNPENLEYRLRNKSVFNLRIYLWNSSLLCSICF